MSLLDRDFSIFARREQWPEAKGLIFISDAIQQASDAIWGSDDADLEPLRERIEAYDDTGVLGTMVKLFQPLLVNASLTAHVRIIGASTGSAPLRQHAWDNDEAVEAISSGIIAIVGNDGVRRDHWVFLDRVEFDLLLHVCTPVGHGSTEIYRNLVDRHDRLMDIVLTNLSAIARTENAIKPTQLGAGAVRAVASDDPSPEEFEQMFAGAQRLLEPHHQIALEERIAGWLVARFDDDSLNALQREHFEEMAKSTFAPYGTDDRIRRAWTRAIATRPKRFKGGRPRRSARSKPI